MSGVAAGLFVNWLAHDLVASVLGMLARFSPRRTLTFAGEAQPLMASESWRPVPLWDQFTTSLFLAVLGLAGLVSRTRRGSQAGITLLLVWTGAMVAATVGQVRFSYYLAVNVALCAGYTCDLLIGWGRASDPEAAVSTSHRFGPARLIAVVVLAALMVVPNVSRYQTLASVPANPSTAWIDTLYWLRTNTPDPFGDPQVYYASFDSGRSRPGVAPPRSTYGVLSWWDYGYWVLRLGRRVPIANPTQTGAREAAGFLLAEDESAAALLADGVGARYVIVNCELQARLSPENMLWTGFLDDMAGALGEPRAKYVRVARKTIAGESQPVLLYEPAYYRTMMSRLYLADHDPPPRQAAAWAVTIEERTQNGSAYWELLSETPFSSREEAAAFVEAADSPNVRLVGKDPFVSCVPLPPLQEFVRAYRSPERIQYAGRVGPSFVQVFERVR